VGPTGAKAIVVVDQDKGSAILAASEVGELKLLGSD
jgi:hypothetical protein